jgi:hypothetical protein
MLAQASALPHSRRSAANSESSSGRISGAPSSLRPHLNLHDRGLCPRVAARSNRLLSFALGARPSRWGTSKTSHEGTSRRHRSVHQAMKLHHSVFQGTKARAWASGSTRPEMLACKNAGASGASNMLLKIIMMNMTRRPVARTLWSKAARSRGTTSKSSHDERRERRTATPSVPLWL